MPLLSYNQHRMANGAESPSSMKPQSRAGSREDTATSIDGQNETSKQAEVVESKSKALLRDEFLINMQKFALAISRTLQQIEGEVCSHLKRKLCGILVSVETSNPELTFCST